MSEGEHSNVTTTTTTQDTLSYAIQVAGRVVLYLDLIWAIAWLVVGIIIGVRVTPIPPTIISGLPLSAYDGTAEYRFAHRALAFHFLLPGVIFLLASTSSHDPIIIWYSLPIGAVVFTDVYANLENWLHLSQDAIPEFFVLETVMATSALVVSLMAFLWYQTAYWHFYFTGHRFDRAQAPPHPGHTGAPKKDVPVERMILVESSSQFMGTSSSSSGQPRLRTITGFKPA